MISFHHQDPSLESQFRAIILFGNNTATFKFAFAKALLEIASEEKTRISLEELAMPYARNIIDHLKPGNKQTSAPSSKFLKACRAFLADEIEQEELIKLTIQHGFRYVIDAFHQVKGTSIPHPFYQTDFQGRKKNLVITDHLLQLKESVQFGSFAQEIEARWSLVETAWNLQLSPALLEVGHDMDQDLLYIKDDFMRRRDITPVRDALNGYQKGKCFYSFQDIALQPTVPHIAQVDHFFPHVGKRQHWEAGANLDGVWNLVLVAPKVNAHKSDRIPHPDFLSRLHHRNEFFIQSKHPLGETIQKQTGTTPKKRQAFLQKQLDIAAEGIRPEWRPHIELPATF